MLVKSFALFLVAFWSTINASPVTTPPSSSLVIATGNDTRTYHVPPDFSFTTSNQVTCLEPTSTMKISGIVCRNIIQEMIHQPNYKRIQEWREDSHPLISGRDPPPFETMDSDEEGSQCVVEINAFSPELPEYFSWEQVVKAVFAIIGQCTDPGLGGYARIGAMDHMWVVQLDLFESMSANTGAEGLAHGLELDLGMPH